MCAQRTIPFPLRQMFEFLEIDIERAFRITPKKMQGATRTCLICEKLQMCDYDSESRYFRCPNRELLDQLVDNEMPSGSC